MSQNSEINNKIQWVKNHISSLEDLKKDHKYLEEDREREIIFSIDYHELVTVAFPYYRIKDVSMDESTDLLSKSVLTLEYFFYKMKNQKFLYMTYINEFNENIKILKEDATSIIRNQENEVKKSILKFKKIYEDGNYSGNDSKNLVEFIKKYFKKYVFFKFYLYERGIMLLRDIFDKNKENHLKLIPNLFISDKQKYKQRYLNLIDEIESNSIRIDNTDFEKVSKNYNKILDYYDLKPTDLAIYRDIKAIIYTEELNKIIDKNKKKIKFISNTLAFKAYKNKYIFKDMLDLDTLFLYLTLNEKSQNENKSILAEIDSKLKKATGLLEFYQKYSVIKKQCPNLKNFDDVRIENCIDTCQYGDSHKICRDFRNKVIEIDEYIKEIENLKLSEDTSNKGIKYKIDNEGFEKGFIEEINNKLESADYINNLDKVIRRIEFKMDISYLGYSARSIPYIVNEKLLKSREYNQFPFLIDPIDEDNKKIYLSIRKNVKYNKADNVKSDIIKLLDKYNNEEKEAWLIYLVIFYLNKDYELALQLFDIIKEKIYEEIDEKVSIEILYVVTRINWNHLLLLNNKCMTNNENWNISINNIIHIYKQKMDDIRIEYFYLKVQGLIIHNNDENSELNLDEIINKYELLIEKFKEKYKNRINIYNEFYPYLINNYSYMVSMTNDLDKIKKTISSMKKVINTIESNEDIKQNLEFYDTYVELLYKYGNQANASIYTKEAENIIDILSNIFDKNSQYQMIYKKIYNSILEKQGLRKKPLEKQA